MRHYLIALFAILLLATPWLAVNYSDQIKDLTIVFTDIANQIAAVVMHNPRTIAGLQSKYNIAASQGQAKIRILLVPGHEPNYGGAEFGSIKERDLTVELANNLQQILANNSKYQVFVTRSATAWAPEFADYFKNSWQNIIDWVKVYQQGSVNLVSVNSTNGKPRVYHNKAPQNVALRLYGITKWANDNNIDIVIHIHFNDNPGHSSKSAGKYSGFTIYVPEKQYLNSTTTQAIAQTVFRRLVKYNPVSDLLGESNGITYEPDLIAIGAYNTADAASMLIEYGYIYEPQFNNPFVRDLALKDLAFQTYLGLQDFFDPSNTISLANSYDTLVLPYKWKSPISAKSSSSQDIFSLQTAFIFDGLYPPIKMNMNDCPRTGTIGACTKASLNAFQKKYGITGEEGVVGQKTIEKLNDIFSTKI
ncbi:MAG: N-acetylmuramoyl-L-alanine amidase [Patescibacteria group bacterium]